MISKSCEGGWRCRSIIVMISAVILVEYICSVSSFTSTSTMPIPSMKKFPLELDTRKCSMKIPTPDCSCSIIESIDVSSSNKRRSSSSLCMMSTSSSDLFSIRGFQSANLNPSRSTVTALSATSGVAVADSESFSMKDKFFVAGFLLISFMTFALLILSGPSGAWRYYMAGGVCACASHAIATPIDVVKTRKQVDPQYKSKSTMKVALKLIKREGVGVLLAGLGPTVLGYLFEGALKFGIYEVAKPLMMRFLENAASVLTLSVLSSRMLAYILSGVISGYVASLALCPMEALRIRLVAEPESAKKGWIACGMNMVHNEGLRGFFKGTTAMMTKQIPYTVTKQVSFDIITGLIYAQAIAIGFSLNSRNKIIIPMISALIASLLSCISSHPGDMLLSVVNAHEGKRRTREFAKDIWREDGIKGFFTGIGPRFLHVGVIVTSQLMIYDVIKRLCGCGITGM